MAELPQNWQSDFITKICKIYQPKTIATSQLISGGEYPVFGANGQIGFYDKYNHEEQEVLITCRGATCGNINKSKEKSWINGNAMVASPLDQNILDKDFLFFFLNSISFKDYITGSAQPQITRTSLEKLSVLLPPLNEQKRIVKKLDSIMPKVDEVNERLERIPLILKRARQSILNQAITGELTKDWRKEHIINKPSDLNERLEQERKQICEINGKKYKKAVFIDIDKNKTKGVDYLYQIPESWEWVSIGQVLWDISDGPHFSPKYVDETTGIPFISARNVQYSKIDFSTAKYISKEDYELFSKRGVAEYNDVLLTKGGTTGIATVVDIKKKFGIWVHIALLKYLKKYINPYYLRDALSSHFMYKQSQAQTHGVGNQDLGLTRIVYMALPLPPLEEQEEIVKRVKEAFEKIDKIEEQYKKAKSYTDKLTQSILHKAFKGDLVPQDPNDKPVEI